MLRAAAARPCGRPAPSSARRTLTVTSRAPPRSQASTDGRISAPSVAAKQLRPVRLNVRSLRQYGSAHGKHEEHGHHPPPKSLVDEYGLPIEYDKRGEKITGQDPFFYAEHGVKREFEGWELIYFAAFAIAAILTVIISVTKEDTSLTTWAQREIVRRRALREKQQQEPTKE